MPRGNANFVASCEFFFRSPDFLIFCVGLIASDEITGERVVKQGMLVNVDSIIPNSLRGIYTSRVDHLSQTQQVVVKVASIVGR